MRYCENKGTCVYLVLGDIRVRLLENMDREEERMEDDGMWVVSIFIFWAITGSIAIVMSCLECWWCGSQTRAGPRIVSPGPRKQSTRSHITPATLCLFSLSTFLWHPTPAPDPGVCKSKFAHRHPVNNWQLLVRFPCLLWILQTFDVLHLCLCFWWLSWTYHTQSLALFFLINHTTTFLH